MGATPSARYGVGVFRTWPDLVSTAGAVTRTFAPPPARAILAHSRRFDEGYLDASLFHLAEPAGRSVARPSVLPLADEPLGVSCTDSALAAELTRRASGGARTLGSALSTWMMPRLGSRLEADVRAGHLLLWVRIASPEYERPLSSILLAGSPARVEIHDLVSSAGDGWPPEASLHHSR